MKTTLAIFKVFQHSDEYFEFISNNENSKKHVISQMLVILIFTSVYGVVMGSYNGVLQSLVSGVKIPVLIFLSLLICFPALFVIQYMIGSTMTLSHMTNTILSGFVVFATIALSFSPIVVFFMITSNNYAFLKLLHVAIFVFSGIFAVRTIINGLVFSCEKKNIYPKLGMNIFKTWIIIFAFVSSQLAWSLRPFVGNKDMAFQIFREHEGNFYVAVFQSVGKIFKVENTTKCEKKNKVQTGENIKKENERK